MDIQPLITASASSLAIAPIVGAYLVLSAIGLLRKGEASSFLSDIARHPAALHAVGSIAFFAGASLLSLHRHWGTVAEVAINLVAMIWLVEGAGLLADPARLRRTLAGPKAATGLRLAQGINLPFGLYLLVVGAIGSPG